MRWIKKREFMVFIYLSLKYGGSRVSIHDIVFSVKEKFAVSVRTSKNIIKRLIRSGYIVEVNGKREVLVRSIEDVMNELLGDYITKRAKRVKRKTSSRYRL